MIDAFLVMFVGGVAKAWYFFFLVWTCSSIEI